MTIRKTLLIFLIILPLLVLTACNGKNTNQQNQNKNLNKANINTITELETPTVTDIRIKQLHQGDELPHRYQLTAEGSYKQKPLTTNLWYNWQIDCGYYYKNKNLGQLVENGEMTIEWRYDTDQECVEATAGVYAADPEGSVEDGDIYSKKLFESSPVEIEMTNELLEEIYGNQ